MLSVAKAIKNVASVDVIVGYRDKELFLVEDLEKYASVHVATEDGSVGTKGTVMNVIEECYDGQGCDAVSHKCPGSELIHCHHANMVKGWK